MISRIWTLIAFGITLLLILFKYVYSLNLLLFLFLIAILRFNLIFHKWSNLKILNFIKVILIIKWSYFKTENALFSFDSSYFKTVSWFLLNYSQCLKRPFTQNIFFLELQFYIAFYLLILEFKVLNCLLSQQLAIVNFLRDFIQLQLLLCDKWKFVFLIRRYLIYSIIVF